MTAALASRSDVRAFFGALAFPATSAVLLAFALLTDPRGPLVGLMVNVFVLFEVSGVSQVVRLPMPTDYFGIRRFERRWVYEALGIRAFKRLMRSAIFRRFNPRLEPLLKAGRPPGTLF